MTNKNQLFYLMQIAGGTFPSGGFSQSWGLETYVSYGKVADEQSFVEFAETYLESTLALCEGPIMCRAYELSRDWDSEKIKELEELSCAVKVTKESRESSVRMGKAFMRIMADITEDEKLPQVKKLCGPEGITYPVIYGLVCGRVGLDMENAMESFVFSTVNALVQSAVKLIPLGNKQAQKILLELYPAMEKTVRKGLETPVSEISNFCPGIDIASIAHESLPTRLYMS